MTLRLKWPEFAVIASLVVVATLVLEFRSAIASSWLIANLARNHLFAAAVAIAAVSFLVGVALSVWKQRQLFVYGVGEIVVGVFSAFVTARFLWPNGELSKFVTLASAVYVVSRGANNVAEALEKEKDMQRLESEVEVSTPPPPPESWPPSITK